MPDIEVVLGDITKQPCEALVNAANSSLQGGGGVDGAIHRAAGPELARAGRALAPCQTGDAKATPAFRISPARHVIHTVGPVWRGGGNGEAELLASCYRRSLEVADELGAASVAFPAISTGIYGYPPAQAARVAVATLASTPTRVREIRLVAFDAAARDLLAAELAASQALAAGQDAAARLVARVEGIVQGVGFRASAARVAASLGLAGWAANRGDGSVEIVAEGPRGRCQELLDWLAGDGAPGWVKQVTPQWQPPAGGLAGFTAR